VRGGVALLVTAHPDDESMFFVPAIAALRASGWRVRLLCLSNGDGDGDGAVRAAEAAAAGLVLGLPAGGVVVRDVPALRDGLRTVWPPAAVAAEVAAALRAAGGERVRLLLTFDARGVSGHANHGACHAGVRALLAARGGARPLAAYALETVCVPRKFSSLLDALPSAAATCARGGPPAAVLVASAAPAASHAAMRAHASQYVWHRRFFVACSRHTFVNTFTRVAA
jgi:N-acetylglucosaminylphosphatidylinositol deacetylase